MPSFPSRFLLTSLLMAMLWLCSAGHSLFAQQQQFGPSPVDPLVFETDSPRYTDCVDVAAWDCPTCDDWVWTFLPKGFLYTTYWAGAAEPRLGVQVLHEKDDGAYVDSWIGGRVGFVRFGSRESLEGWQLDLLAGVRLRQDPDEVGRSSRDGPEREPEHRDHCGGAGVPAESEPGNRALRHELAAEHHR